MKTMSALMVAALAAAHAETGNFDEAVAQQRLALDLKDYAQEHGDAAEEEDAGDDVLADGGVGAPHLGSIDAPLIAVAPE